jgi:hypothetical protein
MTSNLRLYLTTFNQTATYTLSFSMNVLLELLWAWVWSILGRNMWLLDTQTLLSKCSCVLTDTNFIYDIIMAQQDVTYKDRDLSSRGNLAMPQAANRRPLSSKAGSWSQSSSCGICGEESGTEALFLQAGLPWFNPVSFHQCCVLIFRASAIKAV